MQVTFNVRRSYLFFVLAFFTSAAFIFWLIGLYHRHINLDDAWLAEQSYWLAKEGRVKSLLFEGLNQYHISQLVYHKLFIWQGTLAISLLGWNLYILKSISLLYFSLFLVVYFKYYLKEPLFQKRGLLAFLIIFSSPWVFEFSFVFRPEIMLMTLGFLSFLLLEKNINNDDTVAALGAGIMAGLAALTHLNGLIFGVGGIVTLLCFRKAKSTVLFGGLFTAIVAINLINIQSLQDLQLFLFQFRNDPALDAQDFSLLHYLLKVTNEHSRFLHSTKEISFTLLLVLCLGLGWHRLKEHKMLCIYTLALTVSLALLAHGKTTKYMLLYFPHLLTLLLITLPYLLNRFIIIGALIFYLMAAYDFNIPYLMRNEDQVKKHERIATAIHSRGEKIIAPLEFIFNEIEYSQIQGTTNYSFFKKIVF
jgi:hypothetical protein